MTPLERRALTALAALAAASPFDAGFVRGLQQWTATGRPLDEAQRVKLWTRVHVNRARIKDAELLTEAEQRGVGQYRHIVKKRERK